MTFQSNPSVFALKGIVKSAKHSGLALRFCNP